MDTRIKIDDYLFRPLVCNEMKKQILELIENSNNNIEAAEMITSHVLEYTEWLQMCCDSVMTEVEGNSNIALWNVYNRFIINAKSESSCVIEMNDKIYKYWIDHRKDYHK